MFERERRLNSSTVLCVITCFQLTEVIVSWLCTSLARNMLEMYANSSRLCVIVSLLELESEELVALTLCKIGIRVMACSLMVIALRCAHACNKCHSLDIGKLVKSAGGVRRVRAMSGIQRYQLVPSLHQLADACSSSRLSHCSVTKL